VLTCLFINCRCSHFRGFYSYQIDCTKGDGGGHHWPTRC